MPAATVTIKVPAREATDIRNICDEPSNNPVLSSNSASGERAYKTTITLLKYFQIVVQKIYFTITSKINDFSCAAAFARKKARRPRSFGRMSFVLAQLFLKYWKKKRVCTTIVTGKYVPKICKLWRKSRTKMVKMCKLVVKHAHQFAHFCNIFFEKKQKQKNKTKQNKKQNQLSHCLA